MLPPFFSFNLSSPSGIAFCTALCAIRRFRVQHCSRSSDPDKFTFLLHCQNFSSFFKESLKGKGLFHVTSVADPDPGSGIRCLFDPWIRDPE
jgi:hypothetical protein